MTQSISRTQPAIGKNMASILQQNWGPHQQHGAVVYTCRALNSANTLSECGSLLLQSLHEGAHLHQYLKGDLVRF